jgi:hypothetical protein
MPRRRSALLYAFGAFAGALLGCQLVLGLDDHQLTVRDTVLGAGLDAARQSDAADGSSVGSGSFCAREPGHFFCADFDEPAERFGLSSLEQRGGGTMELGDAAISLPASLRMDTPDVPTGNTAARAVVDLPVEATWVRAELDLYMCTPAFANQGNIEFLKLEQDTQTQVEIGLEGAFFQDAGSMSIEIPGQDSGTNSKVSVPFTSPPTGRWTHVTFTVTLSGVSGSILLAYDGDAGPPALSYGGPTRSADLKSLRLKVGVFATAITTPCTGYVDNLTVDVQPSKKF